MLKSELLFTLQEEIRRHDFSYFIDEPPSVARGGRGVCVPGCSSCRKRAAPDNESVYGPSRTGCAAEGYRQLETLRPLT